MKDVLVVLEKVKVSAVTGLFEGVHTNYVFLGAFVTVGAVFSFEGSFLVPVMLSVGLTLTHTVFVAVINFVVFVILFVFVSAG